MYSDFTSRIEFSNHLFCPLLKWLFMVMYCQGYLQGKEVGLGTVFKKFIILSVLSKVEKSTEKIRTFKRSICRLNGNYSTWYEGNGCEQFFFYYCENAYWKKKWLSSGLIMYNVSLITNVNVWHISIDLRNYTTMDSSTTVNHDHL